MRDALSGLFSRATGYRQFFTAVQLARERLRAAATGADEPREAPDAADGVPTSPAAAAFVGKDRRRVDGVKLVAGMKAFVEDRVEPGSCVLRMLRSPHAHARIRAIDTTAAEALPGVVAGHHAPRTAPTSATAARARATPSPRRTTGACSTRCCATTATAWPRWSRRRAEVADAALALIDVEYEVLEPVLGIDEAMAERGAAGPPRAHRVPAARSARTRGATSPRAPRAPSATSTRAFLEADVVVERTYTTSRVQCTPLEPHVVYTRMDGDRLVIHASTQVPVAPAPHRRARARHRREPGARHQGAHRRRLRRQAGHPARGGVRVRHLATGRPVFHKYTREEEFIAATVRHPFRVKVKMGAQRDGTLTAIRMSVDADTGAYGNHCLTVPMNACSKSLPLFRCANVAFEVSAWYTNHVPSGAYQGYGAPQGSFAVQLAAAELAAELGMDQLAFLEKNRVREGDVLEILRSLGEGREGAAVKVGTCGLGEALARGRADDGMGARAGRARAAPPAGRDVRIGHGVAIIQQGSGLPGLDQACASVTLLADGTCSCARAAPTSAPASTRCSRRSRPRRCGARSSGWRSSRATPTSRPSTRAPTPRAAPSSRATRR